MASSKENIINIQDVETKVTEGDSVTLTGKKHTE